MITFQEGHLEVQFPSHTTPRKFDEEYRFSHGMKAVDFIIELDDRYLFIEFKDAQDTTIPPIKKEEYIKSIKSGKIDHDLKYKYRDTFLYEYAAGRAEKDIYYYVLLASDTFDSSELLSRSDTLKRILPVQQLQPNEWMTPLVKDCTVFTIQTWNKHFPIFPIRIAS